VQLVSAEHPEEPVDLSTIRQFIAVGDYGTSGQPTEDQLHAVAEHGYEVIVNLGLLDPKYCLPDEAGTVRQLGMVYHHIPVDFQNPTAADFDHFRQTLLAERGRKVFVHCAANLRVSCFMALFGEAELGWTREQAEAHFRKLWPPNEVWTAFFEATRTRQPAGR
jgi:protein tyrosine phosphatase (PTP) superfamily phosphohydrolase (DUF442 family)